MSRKKSVVKTMIEEALGRADSAGFEKDPELNDDSEVTGPERFAKGQKAKDEVIIDSQLADIAGQEGYFLKLKKEMRPGLGEWMLMKTIETEWRRWADTETEVARIVREHTRNAPAKWGSGPYRIEYGCKGGMRGKTYPTKDFWINAEEEYLSQSGVGASGAASAVDPATQVTAQLDTLSRLLEVSKTFQPPQIDPAKTQEQIAAAFTQGMGMKAGESNQSSVMMTTIMTGLMGMMTAMMTNNRPVAEAPRVVNPKEELTGMLEVMKNFGVLSNQTQEKPKGLTETLTELKAIGIDIFKKEDPMEQMGKLKQFASIASDLMGIGGTAERPSIFEKIVDMLGPALPGMVKEIADASKNAVAVQVEAGKNIERAKIAAPMQPSEGVSMHTAPNTQSQVQNPQVQAFFNGLHDSVRQNNRMYYPFVYTSLLQDPKGVELITGIVNGTHTAKELIEMLQSFGDPRFKDSEFVMKHLISYTNGFIIWLREMVKPKQGYGDVDQSQQQYVAPVQQPAPVAQPVMQEVPKQGGVDIECVVCHTVFVYDSLEDFMQEETKVCEHNGCQGALSPVQKAI